MAGRPRVAWQIVVVLAIASACLGCEADGVPGAAMLSDAFPDDALPSDGRARADGGAVLDARVPDAAVPDARLADATSVDALGESDAEALR